MSIGSPIALPSYLLSETELCDLANRIWQISYETDTPIEDDSVEANAIKAIEGELDNRGTAWAIGLDLEYTIVTPSESQHTA